MTCKDEDKTTASAPSIPSRDMPPLPDNFGPVFFRNQFRTKIELPTADQHPNLKRQCAIITGSNSGLGFEAARQLLALGLLKLVMGVRSLKRGQEAAKLLRKSATNPDVSIIVWELDMESTDSIRSFARRCQDDISGRIDLVVLNAGIAATEFQLAPSGHERTLQVNHYGTALLAILLLPILKSRHEATGTTDIATGAPPSLTVVNSVTAHLCKLPNLRKRPFLHSFDDTGLTPFDAEERYGASKLVSQLFFVKLSENVDRTVTRINMVDPGLTKGTSISRNATGATAIMAKIFFGVAGRSVDRGAATYLHAALDHGPESHGCFLMNSEIAPLAKWYYEDNKGLADLVWIETMQDGDFADALDIGKSLGREN